MKTNFTKCLMKSIQRLTIIIAVLTANITVEAQVDCSNTGNLLLNPSFESGVSNWTPYGVSASNFYANNFAPQCGFYHSELRNTSNISNAGFFQDVTGIPVGNTVTLKAYAGVHNTAYSAYIFLEFYSSSWSLISKVQGSEITTILPSMAQYTVTATVPANTTYVRAVGFCDGDYLKTDQWTLTTNTPASCVCPGNLVQNPSFENGTTNWSWSGGFFNSSNGAVACGTKSGDFQITNTSSNWVSQTIATDPVPGTTFNVSVYAGTHDNTYYHDVSLMFFDASWNWLSSSVTVEVNKVLASAPVGPQLYTFSGAAPVGAKYVQVGFSGNNGWIKTDNWCVTSTVPNCTGKVTYLLFNKLDGGADLPVTNGSTFTVAQLGSLYNLEANTTGTVGSVQFTITGPTSSGNIENTNPFNSPASGGGAWTGAVGSYSVNMKVYSAASAGGILCHDTTINFTLSNNTFNCTCPGNVVLNPSFESGTTNWSWGGGTLSQGTGGTACGTYSGDLNNTTTGSWASQTIGTDLATGSTINVSVYAGTHDASKDNYVAIMFKDINWANVGTQVFVQVDKVLANTPVGPSLYTLTGTVPAGTKYTQVVFGGNGSYTKTDQWCATITAPTTGSIGDKVFNDYNGNGIQDAGEPGIAGVTIQLKNGSGTVIATTNTNASGNYIFSNLNAGNYTVTFPLSVGNSVVTTPNQGADDNLDSDASQSNGNSQVIALASGQNITNVDAGYCPTTLQLGNLVFIDANNDGVKQTTEAILANVIVRLYKDDNNDNIADGGEIARDTTDASGVYWFTNLAPGNYIVGAIPPANYTSSTNATIDPDNNTDNDDNGSILVGVEWRGNAITLSGSSETNGTTLNTDINSTYDFGFITTGCIGDRLWLDANGNGIQDATETIGLIGLTVQLKNNLGTVIATSVTNATGFYQFCGLTPGNYKVVFPISAGDSQITAQDQGADDTKDSDGNQSTGETATIALGIGQNISTVDAGYCPTILEIGNIVFNDLNNDGIKQTTETGISGVVLNLYKDDNNDNVADGAAIATVTTDANGNYLFANLIPGNYIVGATPPSNFVSSSNAAIDPDNDVDNDDNGTNLIGTEWRGLTLTLAGNSENNGTSTTANTNNTYDFGFYQNNILSLGNLVWYDRNNNGRYEVGEPLMNGVVVKLYNDNNSDNIADGSSIASTTTNSSGVYIFNNLTSGNYIVSVDIPTGYTNGFLNTSDPSTGTNPNGNLDNDNNGVTNNGFNVVFSNFITLSIGGEPTTDGDGNNGNLTLDFGLKGTGSISDFTWLDANGNGIQDVGEPGIPGVTVTLTYPDGTTTTTTTDANGLYIFPNLAPGTTYSVAFSAPIQYAPTSTNQGSDDTKDSDPVSGIVTGVTVTAGQNNNTIDAGFFTTVNLGNFVWYDKNNNGIQDSGEPGIVGVTVKLYRDNNTDNIADGAAIATTTTNASGIYNFSELVPGNYIVGVVIPAGYIGGFTTANSGNPNSDNNTDNNGWTTLSGEFRSNFITLNNNTEPTTDGDGNNGNLTLDFGFRGTGSIGNFVFDDKDGDGVQDAGEPGIPGTTVTLTYPDGTTTTTTTDGNGNYNFPNLAPGTTYQVTFGTPAGFTPATPNQGGNDETDSDPVGGVVTGVTVVAGTPNNSVDAGYYQLVNVGNVVFYDQNNNGTNDATDPKLGSVTVNLYRDSNNDGVADGAAVATTTTDASGVYNFTGLKPDTYIIGVVTPSGYAIQPINGGDADNNTDNDNNGVVVAGTEVRSNPVTLTASAEPATGVDGDGTNGNLTVDFGFKGTGSISDFVFNDANGNGVQDAGETGIPNATVTITFPNGQTATTTTDANGNYNFPNLAPTGVGESYSVAFTTPSGLTASPSNQGGDDATDSDPVAGVVSGITLTAGESNTTVDAGFFSANVMNLGNLVWYDKDNDGIKDATEAGIPSATVKLYADANNDGVADGAAIATTTTDANGVYNFGGLAAGNYIVGVTTPAGYTAVTTNGGDPDNNTDNDNNGTNTSVAGEVRSGTVTLALTTEPTTDGDGNNGNLTVDIALTGTGSIGNFVFDDKDGDGVQDAGEPGIPGTTVTLTYPDGTTTTTTTDGNGNYNFPNLAPGTTYQVTFGTPAGFTPATPNQGGNDETDSDPVGGVVTGVTVVAGTPNNSVDAGYYKLAQIGNFVFNDINLNGVQDAGETGISGVTVTLTKPGGLTETTSTDANGLYQFTNLIPGNYSVSFTTPANAVASPSNVTIPGATDANDSDPVGGVVSNITLNSGDINNTIDAGFNLCNINSGINGPTTICANEPVTFSAIAAGVGSVYSWTFQNGSPATYTGSSTNVSWATPGEYGITLTVTKDGCIKTYNTSIVITQSVFAATGPNQTLCAGGLTTLNGSGPSGANYVWSVISGDPTSIDNGANQTDAVVSPNATTTYMLSVSQNGCTRTALITVFVNVNYNPIANAGTNKTTCANTPITIGGTPTGVPPSAQPTAPLGYQWSPALGLNDPTSPNPTVTLTTAGTYDYQVIVYNIITGCSDTATTQVVVNPSNLSLGSKVWYDKNNDGINQPTEKGIANVAVKLYSDINNDNTPDGAAIATTNTDVDGNYNFASLCAGNYVVGITIPTGYVPVTTNGGDPDNDIDLDNNGTVTIVAGELRSRAVTLAAGTEPLLAADGDDNNGNNTVDFALTGNSGIGNYVWYDLNRNGIQNTTETGINNVKVKLTYPDGSMDSTTTNASGKYSFDNLYAGNYSLVFETPVGLIPTTSNVTITGATDANDSDPVAGAVAAINLPINTIDSTYDAGFHNPCSGVIRGNVWHDLDEMVDNFVDSVGAFQTIAVPNGLRVSLVRISDDIVVKTGNVTGTGTFTFAGVAPGNYYIVLSVLPGIVGNIAPDAKLPTNWVNTGEKFGTTAGRDAQINGMLNVTIGFECIANANFGIKFKNRGIGID